MLQPHALPLLLLLLPLLLLRRLLLRDVRCSTRASLPKGHCTATAGGRRHCCTSSSRLRCSRIGGRRQQRGGASHLGALDREVPAIVEQRRGGRKKKKRVRWEQARPSTRMRALGC
jgi:hypothetical protein